LFFVFCFLFFVFCFLFFVFCFLFFVFCFLFFVLRGGEGERGEWEKASLSPLAPPRTPSKHTQRACPLPSTHLARKVAGLAALVAPRAVRVKSFFWGEEWVSERRVVGEKREAEIRKERPAYPAKTHSGPGGPPRRPPSPGGGLRPAERETSTRQPLKPGSWFEGERVVVLGWWRRQRVRGARLFFCSTARCGLHCPTPCRQACQALNVARNTCRLARGLRASPSPPFFATHPCSSIPTKKKKTHRPACARRRPRRAGPQTQ
jgi:hypothetical protein